MLSVLQPSGTVCCCDAQPAARPAGWAAMGLGMRSQSGVGCEMASRNLAANNEEYELIRLVTSSNKRPLCPFGVKADVRGGVVGTVIVPGFPGELKI